MSLDCAEAPAAEETVLLPVVRGLPARGNESRPPLVASTSVADGTDLGAALRTLRAVVGEARYPLDHGDATAAREAARALRSQLDDYLMPRADRLDAPLLAVVGGSTGAGKSTLVNSLVRAPVSRAGVLRPTTMGPVLVCNAADGAWFSGQRLAGLARASEPGTDVLHMVTSPVLHPGLALLDAPDIDSVVARNRELAQELLGAADLWLFVTTAARYADEVPWRVLRQARDRGTVVAVVLDRVPAVARDEVAAELSRLLSEQGLPAAPLFAVNESTLDGQGLIPADQVEPIEVYLNDVAASDVRRRSVTRRSLLGAVAAAAATTDDLARAAVQQCAAADALTATVRRSYERTACGAVRRLAEGAVLRGGVYAHWRDAVASGELQRALRVVREPDRARPAPAPPGQALHAAIAAAIAALLVEAEAIADEEVADRWRLDPAARTMLEASDLDSESDHSAVAARGLVSGWQAWLRTAARRAAPAIRTPTRGTTTAAVVLLATVAAVAPPAAAVTGVGAPSDALRRVLAEPSVAALGERALDELRARVSEHYGNRARRWLHGLGALDIDPELAPRLRQAAADVSVARRFALDLPRAA